MSMPLACTVGAAVAKLRAGQAKDHQAAGEHRQHPTQRPARLRVSRATWRARLTLGHSMAATAPRRPRQSSTSGRRASSQSHWG